MRFNRFNQHAALCALLLCFSLNSVADEFQDANKLFRQGQITQALIKVDAILANKPKDGQARFLKALILTEQGQTEESVRIYTALTEDYPDLPEPYNNLAVLYANQGQYEKAKIALEKALHTHPSYSTAHENLGDIYAKMASQAYDRALQLDRSKTSSITKLALIKDMYSPVTKSNGNKIQLAGVNNPPAASVITTTAASTPAATVAAVTTVAPETIAKVPPASIRPAAPEAANANDEVLNAVNDWAKAWSSRNVKKYLAMYARDFKTPNNESRSSWEQQRRERIDKPQPIIVNVSNAKVKMLDDGHASVSFIQSYRSGALNSTTRKTLLLSRSNGAWQILSEQTGAK